MGYPDAACSLPASTRPARQTCLRGANVFAFPAGEATLPLFALVNGLLGAGLSLLAEVGVGRALPHLRMDTSTGLRITTAVITGGLCAAMAFRFGYSWPLAGYLVLVILGVQLSLIDIRHHLLPNRLVLALLIAGMIALSAASAATPAWDALLRGASGGAILFVIYLILAIISPRGLGMGDVKLAGPLGLYLGYLGWPHLLYGGLLGFIAGGVVTVVILLVRRGQKPTEEAHGPSMVVAAIGIILLPS
jgi:leader peptidase (prepilin peptidase)/N-methyltransferase